MTAATSTVARQFGERRAHRRQAFLGTWCRGTAPLGSPSPRSIGHSALAITHDQVGTALDAGPIGLPAAQIPAYRAQGARRLANGTMPPAPTPLPPARVGAKFADPRHGA